MLISSNVVLLTSLNFAYVFCSQILHKYYSHRFCLHIILKIILGLILVVLQTANTYIYYQVAT